MYRPRTRSRGMGLAVTLMVMFLIMLITFSISNSASRTMTLALNEGRQGAARCAAESGLNDAYSRIKADSSWATGIAETTMPTYRNCTYTVSVRNNSSGATAVTADFDGTSVAAGNIYVRSVGRNGSTVRVARATLRLITNSIFTYAAYAKGNITVSSNSHTDAYNSTTGVYDATTNRVMDGDVGSDGTINLSSNVSIYGSAAAAAINLNGGTVSGTRTTSPPQMTIPNVSTMAAEFINTNNNVTGWTNTGPGGKGFTYNATTKALTGKGTLTFTQAGNYYFSSINIDSNSNILVSPSVTGPVKIYVQNDFISSSNFTITNSTNKPVNMQFYIGGRTSIDSNSTFYATFLGAGNMVFSSNATIYGAIIAGGTVTLDSNMNIHYDQQLATVPINGSVSLQRVMWDLQ